LKTAALKNFIQFYIILQSPLMLCQKGNRVIEKRIIRMIKKIIELKMSKINLKNSNVHKHICTCENFAHCVINNLYESHSFLKIIKSCYLQESNNVNENIPNALVPLKISRELIRPSSLIRMHLHKNAVFRGEIGLGLLNRRNNFMTSRERISKDIRKSSRSLRSLLLIRLWIFLRELSSRPMIN